MAYLDVAELSVAFEGLKALDRVSLELNEGEVLGIVGPNGAGKSTIFNAILGMVPKSGGAVRFRGRDISRLSADAVASRGIIRTFQHTTLFKDLSVYEGVRIGATRRASDSILDLLRRSARHQASELELQRLATEAIEFCGLKERSLELAKNLPYGDQRLAEIAIALAAGPEVLMLDEPAAGMNAAEKDRFVELVGRLRARGVTIVLVEHDMPLVMHLCQRIIVLDHGVKIAAGQPEAVYANPLVVEAYLGGVAFDAGA